MRASEREVRFMAARDLTEHVLHSLETNPSHCNIVIELLGDQVNDPSREVRLNASECLERLFTSEKSNCQGMVVCLLHL